MLHALAMKSPSAAGHVALPGTKAKKPGWWTRLMNGSTSRASCASSSSNGKGPSGGGPERRSRISAGVARRSGGASASFSQSTRKSTVRSAKSRMVSRSSASGSVFATASPVPSSHRTPQKRRAAKAPVSPCRSHGHGQVRHRPLRRLRRDRRRLRPRPVGRVELLAHVTRLRLRRRDRRRVARRSRIGRLDVKPAAVGVGAFVGALAVDLITKTYFVAHAVGPHAVVYNQRPHDLAIRIDVSLLTLAVVYVLTVVARRRGMGRLWGAWIGVGVLLGGTLGNGVS